MPQFDFFSFSVQLFWLVIACYLFHILYLKLAIYRTAKNLKLRDKLINSALRPGAAFRSGILYEKIVSQWFKH